MTHEEILKTIELIFSETSLTFEFDTSKSKIEGPRLYLKYNGEIKEQVSISNYKNGGVLRVFVYEKTPRKSWALIDEVINLLDNYVIHYLEFNELFISSPSREENGDLFVSFIDFDVESCRF